MLFCKPLQVVSLGWLLTLAASSPLSRRQEPQSDTEFPPKHLAADDLAVNALETLKEYVKTHPSEKCTIETAVQRRDWDSLNADEKQDYITALKCLTTKPSISPPEVVPGARSRFDDFVATHINQTMTIHGTGNFLTWHRWYTWTFEKALREECGYKGYQPYYNWPRWAQNPLKAPLFDGSNLSVSGNGRFKEHDAAFIGKNPSLPGITIPAGEGGDCVQDGPFKEGEFSVNLGPVSPVLKYIEPNPQPNGLGYNPRCLRRDMSPWATSQWSTDQQVVDLINKPENEDIYWFQTWMQGRVPQGFLGTHQAGHWHVGGDPGGDLFNSPSDPFFHLHHAMIDRVWWTWQNLKPATRTEVVSDTHTFLNLPPSQNATLEDTLSLGFNEPGLRDPAFGVDALTIRQASSTVTGSPFCYIYV